MKKIILLFVILVVGCDMRPSSSEMEDADRLIAAIETYKQNHHKTPTDEEAWKIMERLELRADERCRPCYTQINSENYVISFGLTVGESYNYNSETKEWH